MTVKFNAYFHHRKWRFYVFPFYRSHDITVGIVTTLGS
jgi:hypothetical protein